MSSIRLITILVLCGLLKVNISYSQENFVPGYIIDLRNDSIHGFIDYRNWSINPNSIVFKDKQDEQVISYNPSDLYGFGVENDRYISGIVTVDVSPYRNSDLDYSASPDNKIDTVFLQVLITGKKSLFYLKDEDHKQHFYIGQDEIFEPLVYKKYIKQEEEASYIKTNEKFRGQLILYFEDCSAIQSKIHDVLYTKKALFGLFKEYYECSSEEASYQPDIGKVKFELGLLGGLTLTKIQFEGVPEFNTLIDADYPWSANFNLGAFCNIVIPRTQGRWSFNNELMYTSFKVNGEVFEPNTTNDNIYTITRTTIGYSYVKLNSLLRYNHSVMDKLLFVNGGVSNGFTLAETNYMSVETQVYSVNHISERKALDYTRRYEPALTIGLGLIVQDFAFELRVERSRGISTYQGLASPITRYFLILRYRF